MPKIFSTNAERIAYFQSEAQKQWSWGDTALIGEIADYLGDENLPVPTLNGRYVYEWYLKHIFDILSPVQQGWNSFDKRVLAFISHPDYWGMQNGQMSYSGFSYSLTNYVNQGIWHDQEDKFDLLLSVFREYGKMSDEQIYYAVAQQLMTTNNNKLTQAGEFMQSFILKDFNKYAAAFLPYRDGELIQMLAFCPKELAAEKLEYLLTNTLDNNRVKNNDGMLAISETALQAAMRLDAKHFAPIINKLFEEIECPQSLVNLQLTLEKTEASVYQPLRLARTRKVLAQWIKLDAVSRYRPYYHISVQDENGSYDYFSAAAWAIKELLKAEGKKAISEIKTFINSLKYKNLDLLEAAFEALGQDSLEIVIEGAKQQETLRYAYDINNFFNPWFEMMAKLDYSQYEDEVWSLLRAKAKVIREKTAVFLSKQGEKILDKAGKLLQDKKADTRQIGALLLSLIGTDAAKKLISDALEIEKNDDARDLMINALAATFTQNVSKEDILTRVANAQKRGKLDKPVEKWLEDSKLPKLFFLDGAELDSNTLRFLLYRQSRVNDMRFDPESKNLYGFIDKQKSADFAKKILKAWVDNGADAKSKYLLFVAAVLGGNEEIAQMQKFVNEWAGAGGRSKMAEHVVKAIALNGSNKALRAVEFFSRKYKSKGKNVGEAAKVAFQLAAEELGIPPYELADSIIPDFGFNGLFREFEAGGEKYRAFIGNDFKIGFLDEDNKYIKAVPKAASSELKEEFKEIAKEIRDIVKAQSPRLEQYLVIQRRWDAEKWQAFFMGNPVMFAYAIRLVWGAYQGDKLQFTFRCLEDQSIVNREGDEIELSSELNIGIVHPMEISEEDKEYWMEHLADTDTEPLFAQLDRPVFLLEEKNKGVKISKEYQGTKWEGYSFVSRMEKSGWNRGSVCDGGWISGYYKEFGDITCIMTQQGEIGAGYLDGNAEINEIMFVKSGSVKFGSYTYDEPSEEKDERLIAQGEVSDRIMSEVLADLTYLKENGIKEEKTL